MSKSGGKGPMRQWAAKSYDARNGRAAASSYGNPQEFYSFDGMPCRPSAQIDAAKAGGQNGAPGVSAMDKSCSADGGRTVFQRDARPSGGPPGGRSDDEHPSRRER